MAKKRKKKYKGPLKAPKPASQEPADGGESRAEEAVSASVEETPAEPIKATAIATVPESSPPLWLALLLLVGASLAAHLLCLWNPFYLDDQAHILKSPQIHNADAYGGYGYRTITYFFWITIHQNLGFNSTAYHALNLIVHTLTVLVFYFAAREFVRVSQFRPFLEKSRHAASIPFWGAALFAVHPLGTEPVNYAAQTSILLVILFTTLATFSMLRWMNSGRWWWIVGIIAFTGLSAFSKKPGFAHSFSNVAIIGVVLWQSLPLLRMKLSPLMKGVSIGLFVLFLAASLYYMRMWGMFYYLNRLFTETETQWHIMTQGRVFWEYIWRLFIPKDLCSDHWIPITRTYGDGQAWMGLVGIVILVLFSLGLYWRKRAYCLLMLLALDPMLLRFLFRNNEPMVEYRIYPTLPWFSLLVVVFVAVTLLPRFSPRVFNIGAAMLVTLFAGMSTMRSVTWNSPYSLADDIVEQYPLHARCHSYIQAVDFSGAGRAKNLIAQIKNPAAIVKSEVKKDGRYLGAIERLVDRKDKNFKDAVATLKEAEESYFKAVEPLKEAEEARKNAQERLEEAEKRLASAKESRWRDGISAKFKALESNLSPIDSVDESKEKGLLLVEQFLGEAKGRPKNAKSRDEISKIESKVEELKESVSNLGKEMTEEKTKIAELQKKRAEELLKVAQELNYQLVVGKLEKEKFGSYDDLSRQRAQVEKQLITDEKRLRSVEKLAKEVHEKIEVRYKGIEGKYLEAIKEKAYLGFLEKEKVFKAAQADVTKLEKEKTDSSNAVEQLKQAERLLETARELKKEDRILEYEFSTLSEWLELVAEPKKEEIAELEKESDEIDKRLEQAQKKLKQLEEEMVRAKKSSGITKLQKEYEATKREWERTKPATTPEVIDAYRKVHFSKKHKIEYLKILAELSAAVESLSKTEESLTGAKDPDERAKLEKEWVLNYERTNDGLTKRVKAEYEKVLVRQEFVRKVLSGIFAHNRGNTNRQYIIARALNSFMFCEQYNGYALIALEQPQAAIDRVTEVIETLKKAVKNDKSMSFAVLYRVRGQANASLGKHQLAADDFRRCLERFPTDLETPRLIQRLPKQFQAGAYPPGFGKK